MRTVIAKEFQWQMSHRLTFHDGLCKHIHGHTYKATIIIDGETDKYGMVMDYWDVEKIAKPLIDKIDHAFICSPDDKLMIDFLSANNFRHVVMNDYTTAENLCTYFLNELKPEFQKYDNLYSLKVLIYETEDVFAEQSVELK